MSEAFRGIFMYGTLEEHLVACLKIPNRRKLIRARVTYMLTEIQSMDALKGIDPNGLTDSQVAALHWLYLMYWHYDHGYQSHPRLRTLFNENFFADPASILQRSAKHFGITLSDEGTQKITRGHVFSKHSKGPARGFSIQKRKSSLATAQRQVYQEVTAALQWAETITSRHPIPEHPGMNLLE